MEEGGNETWQSANEFNGRRTGKRGHNVIGKSTNDARSNNGKIKAKEILDANEIKVIGEKWAQPKRYISQTTTRERLEKATGLSDKNKSFPRGCMFNHDDGPCKYSCKSKEEEIEHYNQIHSRRASIWLRPQDDKHSMFIDQCAYRDLQYCMECYKCGIATTGKNTRFKHRCERSPDVQKEMNSRVDGMKNNANSFTMTIADEANLPIAYQGEVVDNPGMGDCLIHVMLQILSILGKKESDMGVVELRKLISEKAIELRHSPVRDPNFILSEEVIQSMEDAVEPELAHIKDMCKSANGDDREKGFELFWERHKQKGTWSNQDNFNLWVFMYIFDIRNIIIFASKRNEKNEEYFQVYGVLEMICKEIDSRQVFNLVNDQQIGHWRLMRSYNVLDGDKKTRINLFEQHPQVFFTSTNTTSAVNEHSKNTQVNKISTKGIVDNSSQETIRKSVRLAEKSTSSQISQETRRTNENSDSLPLLSSNNEELRNNIASKSPKVNRKLNKTSASEKPLKQTNRCSKKHQSLDSRQLDNVQTNLVEECDRRENIHVSPASSPSRDSDKADNESITTSNSDSDNSGNEESDIEKANDKNEKSKARRKAKQKRQREKQRRKNVDRLTSPDQHIDEERTSPMNTNKIEGSKSNRVYKKFISTLAEQLQRLAPITNVSLVSDDNPFGDLITDVLQQILFVDKGKGKAYQISEDDSIPTNKNQRNKAHDTHGRIRRIQKFLAVGNVKGARRLIKTLGLNDVDNPLVLEALKAKHVYNDKIDIMKRVEWQDSVENSRNEAIEIDAEEVKQFIDSQDKMSASDIFSISTDDLQDLIKRYPESIQHITILVNLIASNRIPPKASKWLLLSRAVAFKKNLQKPNESRPIHLCSTFEKIAGSIIAKKFKQIAKDFCGNHQLGGSTKGGTEIMAGIARAHLEMYDDAFICQIDIASAYNSISREQICQFMADHSEFRPMLAYVLHLLGNTSTAIFYSTNGKPIPIEYNEGVSQGNGSSSLIYNVVQALAYKEMMKRAPRVGAEAYIDDGQLRGRFSEIEDCITALKTLSTELAKIGLTMSIEKSRLYSKMRLPMDSPLVHRIEVEMGIQIVPAEEGIVVCGIPVGTSEFQKAYMSNTIEEVMNEVTTICNIAGTPTAVMTVSFQATINMIRLCIPSQINHLLRGVPPEDTIAAADNLDKHIFKSAIDMMGLTCTVEQSTLTPQWIYARFFSKSSNGGMSITNSKDTAPLAYLGSIALIARRVMATVDPEAEESLLSNGSTPVYLQIAEQTLIQVRRWLPRESNIPCDFVRDLIFNSPSKSVTQATLKQAYHTMLMTQLNNMLPQSDTRRTTEQEKANITSIRSFMLSQTKSITATAWVTANPGYYHFRINNDLYKALFALQIGLPILAKGMKCNRCKKGATDQNAHHISYVCTGSPNAPYVPKLQSAHRFLKHYVILCLTFILGKTSIGFNEPRLIDYYERNVEVTVQKKDVINKGDILVISDKISHPSNTAVIEITIGNVTAKQHGGARLYSKGGDATECIKKNKLALYKQNGFLINEEQQTNAKFVIFAFENFGALHSDGINFIKQLCGANDEEGHYNVKFNRAIQYLSIGIQKARAQHILESICSTDAIDGFLPLPFGQLPSSIGPPNLEHIQWTSRESRLHYHP